MDTWLTLFLQPAQPGFWIVISFVLWTAIRLTQSRWSVRHLRWLNMARWVLIPYAGLMAGSLSPRLMGLTGIDWYPTLGIGVVLSMAVLALLIVIRFFLTGRSLAGSVDGESTPEPRPDTASTSHRWRWTAVTITILASGAEQFHWTFLRGAIWELLLLSQIAIDQPGYWAVWIAALLTVPEILLQPLLPPQRFIKIAILAMTAILFVFTQNFWLCWLLHATAWMLLATDDQ